MMVEGATKTVSWWLGEQPRQYHGGWGSNQDSVMVVEGATKTVSWWLRGQPRQCHGG